MRRASAPSKADFASAAPCPPFGGDDLHHGFGLGQAHAAVFQCAAGKFAGAGGRSTGQVQRFQQALGHGVAAVD